MGICSSCLRAVRRPGRNDSAETSRLLYDDAQQAQYGAIGNGSSGTVAQIDPRDIAREEAALQKILVRASDNLMDIFALQFQPARDQPTPPQSQEVDFKIEHYQRLLQLMSSAPASAAENTLSTGTVGRVETDWRGHLGNGHDDAINTTTRAASEHILDTYDGLDDPRIRERPPEIMAS
ncbi:MAG: hypothetical protein M4579_002455 [Chaenotheca gracillima]|nr:MAG: hypothetical protein M4579_002455 [Chaenotheca gracillima]